MTLTEAMQEAERKAEKDLGVKSEDQWIIDERRKANDKLQDELNQ